ncbi:MAG: SpoIIE family protein phosphatase [Bacteroidales bacterium]|nr:SpoIIE family protein phosphatase [Bacteroidales bacterium]
MNQKYLIFFVLFHLLAGSVIAQLSPALQKEISTNDEQAEKHISEGNLAEAAKLYNHSAYILRNHHQHETAAGYYLKILDLNKQLNNQRGLLITYNNLGMTYLDAEQYGKALPQLEKGLELSRKIDTKEAVISAITNIAVALQGLERYQESNQRLEPAIQMAKDINDLKLLRRCYGIVYENYEKLGQSEKSYQFFELYSSLDKEIKKLEMKQVKQEAETEVNKAQADKQLTEAELKIKKEELEITTDSLVKVEKLTREQRLELEVKNAELREKDALLKLKNLRIRFITIGLIVLLSFSLALTFLLIKLRIANKQIRSQRDLLERQNKNITASIRYAMTIQQAMLPDQEMLGKLFDSFIIYRPKDIVSGDFYWISGFDEKRADKNKYYVAVVDCTGHGVPGAFMSMIGNRLLNEIVNERQVEEPEEILEILNNEVRIALRQEQTDNNDGMDLTLCRFEKQGNSGLKLIFAGAKRTMYIFKHAENELIALKGDRKSIGGVGEKKETLKFTRHEMLISAGDILYMLTDGIIDQNGQDKKRFGSSRVEELIRAIHKEDIKKQKDLLEKELSEYMGNVEQRDDITLIGLLVK